MNFYSKLLASIILSCLFLFGGIMQFFQLISITQLAILVLLLIIIFIILFMNKKEIALLSYKIWPIFLYFFYLQFITFYHKDSLIVFLAYSLGFFFLLFGFLFANKISSLSRGEVKYIINFFNFVIYLQAPFLLFQFFFAKQLINNFNQDISEIDIMFGTFFLKSDSTLGLFLNLFYIFILFQSIYFIPKRKKISLLIYISCIIFFLNSKMTQAVFIIINIYYIIFNIFRLKTYLRGFILAFFIVNLIILVANVNLQNYFDLFEHERVRILNLTDRSSNYLPRHTVVFLLLSKAKMFGNGLYDYYNYITKEWKFFAGHSLWFSLFNDAGPISCILILWAYFNIFVKIARKKGVGFLHFILAVLYSITSYLLYDISAIILLCFFTYIYGVDTKTDKVKLAR